MIIILWAIDHIFLFPEDTFFSWKGENIKIEKNIKKTTLFTPFFQNCQKVKNTLFTILDLKIDGPIIGNIGITKIP